MAQLKDTVVAGNLNVSNRIVGHEVRANCLECFPATTGYGGYIDFHYDGSTADYTSRIIENANGNISINSVNFINSQIRRTGQSKSWVDARDGAILRMTSISGYSPCISLKTTNGSWEMGTYDYDTHIDRLIFTYITDGNYNSNNNAVTGQVQFLGGGHVVANNYYGNGSTLSGVHDFTCTQVWNNSSPTSNFGSQTIYLTSYGYKLYLMKVRQSTSNDNYSYQIINADSQLVKICNGGYSSNAIRTVSAASNYMNFGNAQHGSSSTNNAYCIPTTIWGLD